MNTVTNLEVENGRLIPLQANIRRKQLIKSAIKPRLWLCLKVRSTFRPPRVGFTAIDFCVFNAQAKAACKSAGIEISDGELYYVVNKIVVRLRQHGNFQEVRRKG